MPRPSLSPDRVAGASYLTVREVAELLRCNHKTVRRAIESGEVDAMFASRWLIAVEDALQWATARAEGRLERGSPKPTVKARRSRRYDGTVAGEPGSVADLMRIGEQGDRDERPVASRP